MVVSAEEDRVIGEVLATATTRLRSATSSLLFVERHTKEKLANLADAAARPD